MILTCFPGRAGDLLWACSVIKLISETYGAPVDLQIAGEFRSLVPLLEAQPYLGRVIADDRWSLSQPTPRPTLDREAETYDRVHDLYWHGGWPTLPLPNEIHQRSLIEREWVSPLDLTRPWITVEPYPMPAQIATGWSDCHFELKVGLLHLLNGQDMWVLAAPGSRWVTEELYEPVDWRSAARYIAGADLFLGDCSALHVLAVALGKPVVLVEPMEARWNPIFYPCGMDGPQVTVVKGLDGRPSFDARHTAETLERVLAGVARAR